MSAERSVMIFTPTFQVGGMDQIREATVDSIRSLKWDGETEWVIGRFNPYSDGRLNVLEQYKQGRRIFLDSPHAAMLTIEHDMIVPADALEKLWAATEEPDLADVAYGVYMLRHGMKILNAWRLEGRQYVGQSLSKFPEELTELLSKGDICEVSGCGFGCTLMTRHVLEKLEFHEAEGNGHPVPDIPFGQDCLRNGTKQVAHFGVLCGHIDDDGTVLWPELRGGSVIDQVKVKILVSVNAETGGGILHLEAGKQYEIGEAAARELQRAGYLQILGAISESKTKVLNPPVGLSHKSVKGPIKKG